MGGLALGLLVCVAAFLAVVHAVITSFHDIRRGKGILDRVSAGRHHRYTVRHSAGRAAVAVTVYWMAGVPHLHAVGATSCGFFGGGWIAGYKRGKPENYIWQRLKAPRCRAR